MIRIRRGGGPRSRGATAMAPPAEAAGDDELDEAFSVSPFPAPVP